MNDMPRELVAARTGAATAFADMDRHLGRLDSLARDMVAAAPRRPRTPGTHMPGTIVTRLTAEAEADVHRAARALGVTVSEFGRRALAQAAGAVNRCAAGGLPPAVPFVALPEAPAGADAHPHRGTQDEGGGR